MVTNNKTVTSAPSTQPSPTLERADDFIRKVNSQYYSAMVVTYVRG